MTDKASDKATDTLADSAVEMRTGQETASETLAHLKPFLRYVWRRFVADRGWRMAAGLSYTSLLAIVPLTAIAFSMLAAFPVFEKAKSVFQSAVFDNLLPQSAQAMEDYFNTFISNTAGLSAVGILALAATAVLLLGTIEADLNAIFRVKKPRALVPRLLVFWSMITLGPLLLGASFSLSTYLFAATEWLNVDVFSGPLGLIAKSLPTLIIVVVLSLFYLTIPNRRVAFRAACIGGLSAGTLFAVLRHVFGWYVATFPTYQNIYGALSVVPIFLVWMYLSWTVVLLGAVLTASLTEGRGLAGHGFLGRPEGGERLAMGLRILAQLQTANRRGGQVAEVEIIRSVGGGEEVVEAILMELKSAGFVAETEEGGWVLCRDLSVATLFDLSQSLHLGLCGAQPAAGQYGKRDAVGTQIDAALAKLQAAERTAAHVAISEALAETEISAHVVKAV